jgi:hypothetical protein
MYTQMQGRPAYYVAYDSLADPPERVPEPTAPPRADLPVD